MKYINVCNQPKMNCPYKRERGSYTECNLVFGFCKKKKVKEVSK